MGGPVSFKSRDDLVRSLLCCLHLSFVDSEIRDNSQERSRNEQAEPSCRSVFPSEQADQNGYDGADKRHHQDPHGQKKIACNPDSREDNDCKQEDQGLFHAHMLPAERNNSIAEENMLFHYIDLHKVVVKRSNRWNVIYGINTFFEFRYHRHRQQKMVQDNLDRRCSYHIVMDLQAERSIAFKPSVPDKLFNQFSVL